MVRSITVLCLATLLSSAATASIDRLPEHPQDLRPSTQGQGVEAPNDFGSTNFYYQGVDGAQFSPRLNTTPFERGFTTGAYYCAPGGTQSVARAQVFVPHGVRLSSYRVWIFDSVATHSVSVRLQSACHPDFAAAEATVTNLATVSSTVAFSGASYSDFDNGASGTITDNQSCLYRVEVSFPQGCSGSIELGVQKARLSWQRFTPVAPAVATFTDVPTSAQFFREIEAMVRAGITAGCTATEFCPDQALTRRQMAAFLSRALGLPSETIADPANP